MATRPFCWDVVVILFYFFLNQRLTNYKHSWLLGVVIFKLVNVNLLTHVINVEIRLGLITHITLPACAIYNKRGGTESMLLLLLQTRLLPNLQYCVRSLWSHISSQVTHFLLELHPAEFLSVQIQYASDTCQEI